MVKTDLQHEADTVFFGVFDGHGSAEPGGGPLALLQGTANPTIARARLFVRKPNRQRRKV